MQVSFLAEAMALTRKSRTQQVLKHSDFSPNQARYHDIGSNEYHDLTRQADMSPNNSCLPTDLGMARSRLTSDQLRPADQSD